MFLWTFLFREPRLRVHYETVVDVGSGDYLTSYLYRASRLQAFDVKQPQAPPPRFNRDGEPWNVEFSELDIVKEDVPVKGDLVVCLEVLGITVGFDETKTLEVVSKLVAATKPGGTLILNLGSLNRDGRGVQVLEVSELIERNFADLKRIEYGRGSSRRRSLLSAFVLGLAQLASSNLRKSGVEQNQAWIWVASSRFAVDGSEK